MTLATTGKKTLAIDKRQPAARATELDDPRVASGNRSLAAHGDRSTTGGLERISLRNRRRRHTKEIAEPEGGTSLLLAPDGDGPIACIARPVIGPVPDSGLGVPDSCGAVRRPRPGRELKLDLDALAIRRLVPGSSFDRDPGCARSLVAEVVDRYTQSGHKCLDPGILRRTRRQISPLQELVSACFRARSAGLPAHMAQSDEHCRNGYDDKGGGCEPAR